jgi:hypothetical protein
LLGWHRSYVPDPDNRNVAMFSVVMNKQSSQKHFISDPYAFTRYQVTCRCGFQRINHMIAALKGRHGMDRNINHLVGVWMEFPVGHIRLYPFSAFINEIRPQENLSTLSVAYAINDVLGSNDVNEVEFRAVMNDEESRSSKHLHLIGILVSDKDHTLPDFIGHLQERHFLIS